MSFLVKFSSTGGRPTPRDSLGCLEASEIKKQSLKTNQNLD
jgi:hypothetical protein